MPLEPAGPAIALGPTGLFDVDRPSLHAAAANTARRAVAEKKILMCLVHFHREEFRPIVPVLHLSNGRTSAGRRRLAGTLGFPNRGFRPSTRVRNFTRCQRRTPCAARGRLSARTLHAAQTIPWSERATQALNHFLESGQQDPMLEWIRIHSVRRESLWEGRREKRGSARIRANDDRHAGRRAQGR